MIKKLYKQKGWTANSAIVRHNCVEVMLAIDHRYNFCCSKCRTILKTHSVREISVRDLPITDKDVTLFVDTMQGFYPTAGDTSPYVPKYAIRCVDIHGG